MVVVIVMGIYQLQRVNYTCMQSTSNAHAVTVLALNEAIARFPSLLNLK